MKSLFTPSLFNLPISYLPSVIPPSTNPPSRLLGQFHCQNIKNSSAFRNYDRQDDRNMTGRQDERQRTLGKYMIDLICCIWNSPGVRPVKPALQDFSPAMNVSTVPGTTETHAQAKAKQKSGAAEQEQNSNKSR